MTISLPHGALDADYRILPSSPHPPLPSSVPATTTAAVAPAITATPLAASVMQHLLSLEASSQEFAQGREALSDLVQCQSFQQAAKVMGLCSYGATLAATTEDLLTKASVRGLPTPLPRPYPLPFGLSSSLLP